MTMPTVVDISQYQGDRLDVFIEVITQVYDTSSGLWIDGPPKDLTGFTFGGDVKVTKADSAAVVSFSFSCPSPTAGQVLCTLLPAQTKLLTGQSYVYDIQFVGSPTDIETYVAGTILVTPEVTR